MNEKTTLINYIKEAKKIVFFGGAGVSLEVKMAYTMKNINIIQKKFYPTIFL